MITSPKVIATPTWPRAPVLASTMIAPQPANTSAKVPTNSAATWRASVRSAIRLERVSSATGRHLLLSGHRRASISSTANDGEVIDLCQYGSVQTIATIAASCPPLLQGPLDPDDAERLAGALKAIADPSRLRLLSLIRAQPGHEACVCHLTEPLGLGQPTVSHHLKVLLQAGLVEREQRGSWAYFRVREEPLSALRDLLA